MRKILAFLAALLVASPAWAVTQNPIVVYVDTGTNGGATTNSGTTNASMPLYNSVLGGTGASGVACLATCTATAGTALGAVTASASWTAGATAISFTAGSCAGVVNGMGIWDTTLGSAGLIGVVASSAYSTTCNLTLMTGGALRASSTSGDGLYLSSAVNLSTAATLSSVPGCTSEGSGNYLCDGSQMIDFAAATNTNAKNFMIAGFTSCGGSGTCVIALGATASGGAGSPNPIGVTTSAWVIGGRSILPNTSMEGSLLPGSTVNINTSQACGAAVCFTDRISGDTISGPITLQATSGNVTLSNTGNNIIFTGASTFYRVGPGIIFSNASGSTASMVSVTGVNVEVIGDTFNGGSVNIGSNCVISSVNSLWVIDSIFINCGGYAIYDGNTTLTGLRIVGNKISGTIGQSAIGIAGTNPNAVIANNLIIGATGDGVFISGASTTNQDLIELYGNTIANNGTGGLVVSSVSTVVSYYNNIFYNNNIGGTSTYYNVSYPQAAGLLDASIISGAHGCNDFFTTSGGHNLQNAVANSTEITTNPDFISAGLNWNLSTSAPSPAINTGCYQTPGGVTTNYVSMGALQLNGSGSTPATGASGLIGGM